LWREGFETSWDGMAMTRRATAHRLPLTEEPGWGWGASHVFHDAGRSPAPPRGRTMRAGGSRPRGIARCGPEARAPTGSHDAGRRLAPTGSHDADRRLAPPRGCTMRAGGPRPHGVARCGPEARAPTGSHDAGRRPAPPRGCTGRESSAVGARCSSAALRWCIIRSAKNHT